MIGTISYASILASLSNRGGPQNNQGDHSVRKVRKVRIGQEKEGFFKVVRINAENWPKKSGFLRTLAWSGSKSGFHPYTNLFMAVQQFYPVDQILSDIQPIFEKFSPAALFFITWSSLFARNLFLKQI